MPGQYRSGAIKTAMQVAALAAVTYSVIVCGSSNMVGLPQNVATSAVNVDPARTPLDEVFRDRFNVDWTKEIEGSLLLEAAKKGVAPERDVYNFVHTAQHESLAPDLRRLTEEEVSKLARRKV